MSAVEGAHTTAPTSAEKPDDRPIRVELMMHTVALAVAALVFVALARFLPDPKIDHSQIPDLETFLPELRPFVNPEPGEKLRYQAGSLVFAVVPIGVYALMHTWIRRSPRLHACTSHRWVLASHDALLVFGVAIWVKTMLANSELPKIGLACGVSLVIAAALLLLGRARVARWNQLRIPLLLVLGVSFFRLGFCTEDQIVDNTAVAHHIDLLFGAINQVSHGRTILVDTSSQYGIAYPYFFGLALAPFGVTAASICAAFATLDVISLGFIYLVLRRTARDRRVDGPITELLFVGLIGVMASFCLAAVFDLTWIYYQYFPLRVVWGCFFFWYGGYVAREERPRRYSRLVMLGYALAGLSVLWNADTGLVILIAWTATMSFDSLRRRSSGWGGLMRAVGAQAALMVLAIVVPIALYALFAWVRAGAAIALGDYLRFQRAFYGAGFFMLPMNPWELWQPMLLIPFVAILAVMRRWLSRSADAQSTERLFIALYGIGIFSYYQGRSHVHVLLVVAYPAVMLGALYFLDLLAGLKERRHRPMLSGLALLAALGPAAGLLIFATSVPRAIDLLRHPPQISKDGSALLEQLAAIRARDRGREIPVVSNMANFIHLKTETVSPFPVSSIVEVLGVDQLELVRRAIRDKRIDALLVYSVEPAPLQHLDLPRLSPEQWATRPRSAP